MFRPFWILSLAAAVVIAVPFRTAAQHHEHDHAKEKKKSSSGTAKKKEKAEPERKEQAHEHHHAHEAPHGGTLILFGNEFAHLELLLDPEEGKLTGYALDGEAAQAVRLAQKEMELQITAEKGTSITLVLKPVESVLTGEKIGASSEFAAKHEKLKGLKEFKAVLKSISIKGQEFQGVEFEFPKGNH